MTTAKSQQAPGDHDADDLISELARLMAQDAQADRPSSPVPPRAPAIAASVPAAPGLPELPAIRIPGVNFRSQPAPRFDPGVSAAAQLVSDLNEKTVLPADRPATGRAPLDDIVEPFRFDFGGISPSIEAILRPAVTAAPAPVLAAAPQPVVSTTPSPASDTDAPLSSVVTVAAPEALDFHDSIAELIAADRPLPNEPFSTPVAVAPPVLEVESDPEPEPQEAPQRQEPGASRPIARNWSPTPVAGTRAASATRIHRSIVRPVNLTPVAKAPVALSPSAQPDNFKVAPIFGLGGPAPAKPPTPVAKPTLYPPEAPVIAPPSPQHHVAPVVQAAPDVVAAPMLDEQSDPIDEIESLIGNAVRVDLDQRARPVSSAALRDLAAPVEPGFALPSSSEDPILDAVQASGIQTSWSEPAIEGEEILPAVNRRDRREKPVRSSGAFRAIAGPLVAVALLLVAGLGLYWVLGLGGRTDGTVPKLVADSTPVKAAPTVEATPTDTQQSVVFNEMNGQAPAENEQLVSRDQSDVGEVTQTPAATAGDDGLANRKVRTVTVRPDGTIVSGEDAVAGSTILPVDRPNVPTVPGAETASPELVAAANGDAAAASAPTIATAPAPATVPATAVTTPPVEPGTTVPVVDGAGTVIAGKTSQIPRIRPTRFTNLDQPAPANTTTLGALPTSPANAVANGPIPLSQALAAQGTTPVAAAPAAASPASAYVQLSSQRSQADAQATAQTLNARYGSLFAGAQPEIQRVDLGAKGVFYRVRVPAASQQAASAICGSIKANGGECF